MIHAHAVNILCRPGFFYSIPGRWAPGSGDIVDRSENPVISNCPPALPQGLKLTPAAMTYLRASVLSNTSNSGPRQKHVLQRSGFSAYQITTFLRVIEPYPVHVWLSIALHDHTDMFHAKDQMCLSLLIQFHSPVVHSRHHGGAHIHRHASFCMIRACSI